MATPRTRRTFLASLAALMAASLSGCMLVSGMRSSTDAQPEAGNTSASFLSAEGEELGEIAVGPANTTYEVIAIVSVEQGQLQLDLYDSSGAPAFSVQGRPLEQVTRSARLASNEKGLIRYRVSAVGARNGSYQILYRRVG